MAGKPSRRRQAVGVNTPRPARTHLKSPPGTESVGSCAASSVGLRRLAKPVQTCSHRRQRRCGTSGQRWSAAAVAAAGTWGADPTTAGACRMMGSCLNTPAAWQPLRGPTQAHRRSPLGVARFREVQRSQAAARLLGLLLLPAAPLLLHSAGVRCRQAPGGAAAVQGVSRRTLDRHVER